jgi:alkanesulfonate monooxygenase SsuD/methylene tetrahydromethanopterin reductase-like flavin-dependent oxidoreductase (luciferase family)
MTDYGHELLFGTFLTPSSAHSDRLLALARLTDAEGLDLVSVQDHPYQPAFLDTWTLLSVIAARTERVRVLPNVANLPLRPPVVLARSVATLDLLSGGRVELGLGAGAFYDGIAALGGPRLTAATSVAALEEGIDIIRGIWRADGGSVRSGGTHYSVRGARPGPAPAHDVGIWLGAYKPRMLAVTGRLADGWLPSHAYAGLDVLPAMNQAIDDAALAAGRAPADVRRLYNIGGRFDGDGREFLQGPPALWAEQLAELTLDQGMSAYILASDSPADIQRFAAEVAPAVRELVAARRARPRDNPAHATAVVIQEAPRPVATQPAATNGFDVIPTPDDGVRHSQVRVWDESARPTGPEREPGRAYTAAQRASGAHLIEVHDHLRQELAQIRDLIDQLTAGTTDIAEARSQINAMTMRQNNWTVGAYCESYCRVVTIHHTLEDQSLFPRLRRFDERLRPVVDRLEEEHHTIHKVLEGVDQALVTLVGRPERVDDLRAAVDLLTDTLLSHLSYEERELVEPLSRLGLL